MQAPAPVVWLLIGLIHDPRRHISKVVPDSVALIHFDYFTPIIHQHPLETSRKQS
jgi:hypothetical protein